MTATSPRPFRISVPTAQLDDLVDRLDRTRFTADLPGRDIGVAVSRVRELATLWREQYDWRRWEARINQHPQFLINVDGVDVHALHVRAPVPGAFPLLLIHGWPMSVAEWLDVIDPLTLEQSAFDLVIPSVPGFGFSGVPARAGWDRARIAAAFSTMMHRLGYDRYGVHGNDIGASIALELGRIDRHRVAGVHVTQVFSMPSGDAGELAVLGTDERLGLDRTQEFLRRRGAYLQLQGSQPQTLAHALADSPVGQLAWSLQLLDGVSDDYLLTNVSVTWLTGTAGSSALIAYLEPARATPATGHSAAPIGVSTFDDDVFQSVRSIAERDHPTIIWWRRHPGGSHHPAHHVPATLATDIADFFAGAA